MPRFYIPHKKSKLYQKEIGNVKSILYITLLIALQFTKYTEKHFCHNSLFDLSTYSSQKHFANAFKNFVSKFSEQSPPFAQGDYSCWTAGLLERTPNPNKNPRGEGKTHTQLSAAHCGFIRRSTAMPTIELSTYANRNFLLFQSKLKSLLQKIQKIHQFLERTEA